MTLSRVDRMLDALDGKLRRDRRRRPARKIAGYLDGVADLKNRDRVLLDSGKRREIDLNVRESGLGIRREKIPGER